MGCRWSSYSLPRRLRNSAGFSPRPVPKLIASYRTSGPALAVSRGIDRDRAVDETGNQLAVFGRMASPSSATRAAISSREMRMRPSCRSTAGRPYLGVANAVPDRCARIRSATAAASSRLRYVPTRTRKRG